jgi:putative ABC transport system ATP-binding protein
MTTIGLRGLGKQFGEPGGHVRRLFEDLTLDLGTADRSVAILGRSGSGKSSLLRILAGIDIAYQGSFSVDGEQLRRNQNTMSEFRRRHVGIITQRYDLLGERTALHNTMLGLGSIRAAHREASADALERVGLAGLAGRRVDRLSGGEAQRVAIARAIVKEPSIVLADEPTGALDERTEDEILELFDHLQTRGSTMIIATHSERVAERCSRRFMVSDHRLVEV